MVEPAATAAPDAVEDAQAAADAASERMAALANLNSTDQIAPHWAALRALWRSAPDIDSRETRAVIIAETIRVTHLGDPWQLVDCKVIDGVYGHQFWTLIYLHPTGAVACCWFMTSRHVVTRTESQRAQAEWSDDAMLSVSRLLAGLRTSAAARWLVGCRPEEVLMTVVSRDKADEQLIAYNPGSHASGVYWSGVLSSPVVVTDAARALAALSPRAPGAPYRLLDLLGYVPVADRPWTPRIAS